MNKIENTVLIIGAVLGLYILLWPSKSGQSFVATESSGAVTSVPSYLTYNSPSYSGFAAGVNLAAPIPSRDATPTAQPCTLCSLFPFSNGDY